MRFLQRVMIGLLLAALSLGGIAVAVKQVVDAVIATMSEEPRRRPPRETVRAVNVITFEPATLTPVLTAYGEVLSRRTLDVRATASGTVVALGPNVEEGGRVLAGQLLVRIDPETAQADLEVARADLAEAEANLRDAERNLSLAREDLEVSEDQAALRLQALERQQSLAARGIGTGAAVEDAALSEASARAAVVSRKQSLAAAEARLDNARTSVSRATIALGEAERALADTTVLAPFSGTLGDVAVVEGGQASQNDVLARLVDPSALEVAFRISTAQHARLLDAEGVLTGLPVEAVLEVAGLDLLSSGVIARESPVVGEGQTGRQVFARLDTAAGLRPGDFVTIRVEEPALQRVARLPSSALGADGTVLVLDPEDRLEAVPVRLLRRQADAVLVRGEGLQGRQVVAERTPLLGAGLKVRPIAPAAPGAGLAEPQMLTLDAARKARLLAFVEGNARMPADVKSRILSQLQQEQVPAQVVARLESRMGS